ncbi:MAG: S41 family peptidase [Chloroflexi bacterium]|nr:S41 family peptidase [Chloroflexota bacterium]MCL5075585.1 S41 family peptidase [Chloroflexota bacterium]
MPKIAKLALIVVLALAVVAGAFFAGYTYGQYGVAATRPSEAIIGLTGREPEGFKVFWEVWQLVEKDFYNRSALDPKKITYGSIRGMLEALDDPYTIFASPEHTRMVEEDMRGTFEGIGVTIELKDKKVTIVAPLENSPAERAGLRPGDVIIRVDGKDVSRMSILEIVRLIRGPKGTKVHLAIMREGEPEPIEMDLLRDEIKIAGVKYRLEEPHIAYVKLISFAAPVSMDLSRALDNLTESQPKALILDLRNNAGGLLPTAVEVASQFMPQGIVLYQQDKSGKKEPLHVGKYGKVTDLPMVVLVNKGSASASEIVAGALQDSGRAILIGENTFGKDTVQSIYGLSDTSSVRITTARWWTPKEQNIHQKGLTPDITVKMTEDDIKMGRDPQLQRAISYLKQRVESGN